MADDPSDSRRSRAVPAGRLARLGTFGRLAGGIAGNMIADGARKWAAGERPAFGDLLLTPRNVRHATEQLSHLRGAAMKLGQMISLDAGEFLSPELGDILARLRDRAHYMPPQQLQKVLADAWGAGWRTRFARFEAAPVAAASIGQVHRAQLPDGRMLAVKVQYPGVRRSIDADVDNVATLLRLSGLLPREIDIAPFLEEAKRQLHDEADYEREADQMRQFGALLAGDDRFVVPAPLPALSTGTVLAMEFVEAVPIETLETASASDRNRAMERLIDLVLAELFTFRLMQTDPNFANYRYQPASGRIVLLDFGASRPVSAPVVAGYHALLRAGIDGDGNAVRAAALACGFFSQQVVDRHGAAIDRMIATILTEANRGDIFDFGDRAFLGTVRGEGMAIAADKAAWHIPPADTLFVQRKISGMALLAARLKAKVPLRAMVDSRLRTDPAPAAS